MAEYGFGLFLDLMDCDDATGLPPMWHPEKTFDNRSEKGGFCAITGQSDHQKIIFATGASRLITDIGERWYFGL